MEEQATAALDTANITDEDSPVEQPSVIISCDYTEFKPNSYKGAVVWVEDKEAHRILTGNPLSDKLSAQYWAQDNGYKTVFFSSTWDNFVSDATKHFIGTPLRSPKTAEAS